MNTKNKKIKKRLIFLFVLLVIILACVSFMYIRSNNNSDNKKTEHSNTDQANATTTSDQPSAQNNYSGGDQRDPGNTISENRGTADVTDTGQPNNNETGGLTSSSGEITVFSPISNSVVGYNFTLSGKSSLSKISYRIIDNVSGMIATGELKTINNGFSGKINVKTTATEGRLDIFATKDDSTEYSNIEIPVRFQ